MAALCPNCHRPFSKEVEKKEIVKDSVHEGNQFTGTRTKFPVPLDLGKEIVDFKYYYKCKHCGYEWTEIKQVEFDRSKS